MLLANNGRGVRFKWNVLCEEPCGEWDAQLPQKLRTAVPTPSLLPFFCQTQQQDNETSDGQRIERQIERLLLHRRGRGIGEAAIGSSEIR